jgi:hypothetical protein
MYVDTYYKMLIEKYPNPDDKSYTKGLVPFYLRKVVPGVSLNPSENTSMHFISAFPVISGLLAIPVFAIPVLSGMSITWENLAILAHLAGALIIALSGGFLYLLLKKHYLPTGRKALLLTIIYLFGTINFALISQGLWQHGSIQLFTILGLYFLHNALSEEQKDRESNYFWAGLMLGLAALSRPTAGLSLGMLYILIYINNKANLKNLINRTLYYGLGLIPVIAFFLWYNSTYYLNISNQGYSNQLGNSWLGRFPEGFLGIWLSPSKGILMYSPVFIFAFIGLYLALRNNWRTQYKYLIFAAIVLIHTLVMGKWKHWYGGWSFGYRLSSDILPYLILLLVPYVTSSLYEKTRKLFFILIGFSILVQIYGIIFFDGIWHSAYDLGYQNTSWLWSIKDSEFLFNIRRILVKLGLLDRACPQCLP